MAYGYWQQQIHERRAVFQLTFREHPFGGNFTVAAGLALVTDYLQQLRFGVAEIQYLGSLRGADGQLLFKESFLHYLQRLRFTGELYAIPEGSIVFPNEPLLRVEAPLIQAQLIETALLNLTNFSSLAATKAARVRLAAGADAVLEFGLRRAQGIDGGLTASRAAYLGGCDASSNVWAGQYLGIPVRGTHAHSWVMVYADELEAFARYADALPNNCIFLVDTYDTLEGVGNAITIGRKLKTLGHQLVGIRLDSGDLANLSQKARKMLDQAGFVDTKIVASNDLDEHRLRQLKDSGAQIDTWGVGTRLVTAFDQPALGGVYKLSAIADEQGKLQDRIKRSEQSAKASIPGALQVRRYYDAEGQPLTDMICRTDFADREAIIDVFHRTDQMQMDPQIYFRELLVPIFQDGKVVYDFPSLAESRTFCLQQLRLFERRLEKPYLYGLERSLALAKNKLLEQA
jgi:nicotinate phosphoribosyltransferase